MSRVALTKTVLPGSYAGPATVTEVAAQGPTVDAAVNDPGNAGSLGATSGGTYSGTVVDGDTFTVQIDTNGTPDTFKWKKNAGSFTTGVAITGSAQTLSDGVTVTFAGTTGHTIGDKCTILGSAGANKVALGGGEIVVARNSGGGAHTVTITSVADSLGRTGDVTADSIAAGATHVYGPFQTNGWRQADGFLYLAASDASIKFSVLK